ncbi:MAG: leucine-rich repeat protein [Bacteroidales bacterium]|nr:leucine-rich repeat protein [Candidatus Sodaliphilus aphodohippi]
MTIRRTLLVVASLVCTLASVAQSIGTTFTSGKLTYQIITNNKEVQVTSKSDQTVYSDISSSDFAATVTYNGQTYKVIGIGAGAFSGASFSGAITLPEGIWYLDNASFQTVKGITTLTLPASLTDIYYTAFEENQIGKFQVNANNKNFAHLSTTQENKEYVFLTNKAQNKILAAPGAVVKSSSFFGTNYVTTVTIPTQITELGDAAFYGNPTVKTVNFHKGITKFGSWTFMNTWLTSVNLSNPDAEYGISLFLGCPNLTKVTLPQGIKRIPNYMFMSCEGLKTISLPEGIVEIGKQAFTRTALTSVNLPSTCEVVDSSAFQWIDATTTLDLKNVKRIKSQAFGNMTALTTIKGGEKVEVLENAAFIRCNALTKMPDFPSLKDIDLAFYNCTGLNDVTMPATLETSERNPFVNCTALKEIKVAEGAEHFAEMDSCLYEIKNGKPYRLVSMPTARLNKAFYLQPGTQVVGQQAFRYAPVTEFIAKEGLKVIDGAFMAATALTNIELPSTMEEIHGGFGDSKTITSVKVLAKNPPMLEGAFATEVYSNATLYVPTGTKAAYKKADNWKDFINIVEVDVPNPGLKGDITGDGVVDIFDVNELINAVLGQNETPIELGDLTGDGVIDIFDINELINLILG